MNRNADSLPCHQIFFSAPVQTFSEPKKGLTTLSGQIVNLNEETQMNNKSITPNPQQPVDRVPTGQLPSALAELSEAALRSDVLPGWNAGESLCNDGYGGCLCSYDGDDD